MKDMKNLQLEAVIRVRSRAILDTDFGRFIAQRTMVEGHQGFEDIGFAAKIVIDRIFDSMLQQIQDPTAFVFVLDEDDDGNEERSTKRRTTLTSRCEL